MTRGSEWSWEGRPYSMTCLGVNSYAHRRLRSQRECSGPSASSQFPTRHLNPQESTLHISTGGSRVLGLLWVASRIHSLTAENLPSSSPNRDQSLFLYMSSLRSLERPFCHSTQSLPSPSYRLENRRLNYFHNRRIVISGSALVGHHLDYIHLVF